jgi:hypothetical protein
MKIFFQNNKLNSTVKVIKEERITPDCWNVIIHSFEYKDQKVLYSLKAYKEISEEVRVALAKPEGYELYGSYYETSCSDLKYVQAQCMGVRVLQCIVHQQNIDRNSLIRMFASMKPSMDTVYAVVQGSGWSFQKIEAQEFTNYKPATDDLKLKGAPTPYTKLVDHVLYDEEKRIIIVFFVDGTKIVKKCNSEDKFDIYVGVSLAITKYLFGNNTTNFIKFVDRKKKKLTNKKEAHKQ